jgi:hypothetical protein
VPPDRRMTLEEIRGWREAVNERVAREAGFAYEGYARLKLASVCDFVTRLIMIIANAPPRSPRARSIEEIVNAWATHRGVIYRRADSQTASRETAPASQLTSWIKSFLASEGEALKNEPATAPELPSWVKFFLAFDVDYRKRRLQFMIEGQNRLYRLLDEDRFPGLDPAVVDQLKRAFYLRLDVLRQREEAAFFSPDVQTLVQKLFSDEPSVEQARDPAFYARMFLKDNEKTVDRLIEILDKEIDLNASTRDVDELLASLDPSEWHPEARREVLVNYLGFPFWDVLTFSVTTARDSGELHEILVDRISPADVSALKGFEGAQSLKGTGFGHFAGFFSRGYRENDYLLGRLHALERLVDIVCDTARVELSREGFDVLALKKRAFTRILDREEAHLPHSKELIAALRRSIAEIGS